MSRRDKPFFETASGDPAPLTATCGRIVRFEELDPLRIVWHGRYPSYFEDGRGALGERYGIGYTDFEQAGLVVPLTEWHIQFRKPLVLNDKVTIKTTLHWCRGARINISYELSTPDKGITARGYTVQLILDMNQEVQIVPPPFWADFLSRWGKGQLDP